MNEKEMNMAKLFPINIIHDWTDKHRTKYKWNGITGMWIDMSTAE